MGPTSQSPCIGSVSLRLTGNTDRAHLGIIPIGFNTSPSRYGSEQTTDQFAEFSQFSGTELQVNSQVQALFLRQAKLFYVFPDALCLGPQNQIV